MMLLRLAVKILMLTRGIDKFSTLSGDDPIQFPDPVAVGATASLALTVFSKVFCSILLISGLVIRLVAISLFINMLVAAFMFHTNDGFGKQELPLLYTIICFIIAIAGAGLFSIDNWIFVKINPT